MSATSAEAENRSRPASEQTTESSNEPLSDTTRASTANSMITVRLSEPDSTPFTLRSDGSRIPSLDYIPDIKHYSADGLPGISYTDIPVEDNEFGIQNGSIHRRLASSPGDLDAELATPVEPLTTAKLSELNSTALAVPVKDMETASVFSDRTVIAPLQDNSIQLTDSPDNVRGPSFDSVISGHDQTETLAGWSSIRDSAKSLRTTSFPPFSEEDVFEDASIREIRSRSNSNASETSQDSSGVDWSELEKTEEGETRDEVSDQSTAFLLARLEQENNALTADPRSGLKGPLPRIRGSSRPPSMHMLKKLVRNPPSRLSLYAETPEPSDPPAMTELEFWAALVKDYPQTAQRLPTLTSNKIKGGVPPPLRGVVWVSMVGARDEELAEKFDKLCLDTSPYEVLIGKDVGRSFPGVDMFRDPEGEGQQMLGRVLRAFSLYDTEIGYCQGLGFLVGPLLMQMGDKDAFCVLVKLMENYDLRSCFLPNLAGLHVRIYQFQKLLDQHMPKLAAHLVTLQVEAAYLSQWFLSFFAVTCPLPMLFRIYDIIFAEGASETIMRVALSLMRRNEQKIMESKEFEEVMQLLLSRSLWEVYSFDADDLVNDFMGLTGMVSGESLQKLEASFKATHGADPGAWFSFLPDAQSAASRFLGRMWAAGTPVKGAGLTPNGYHSRGPSFLRRSPSKQSIATINSVDISSEGTSSHGTATTDATSVSRDSTADTASMHSKTPSLMVPIPGALTKEDKDLHSQIEDLLTALSDMQRQHAFLTAALQKEREERSEDCRAVEELVSHLRPAETQSQSRPQSWQHAPRDPESDDHEVNGDHQTMQETLNDARTTSLALDPEVQEAVRKVDNRLDMHRLARRSRASDILETKQRLRDSLIRSQNQMENEVERSAMLTRQLKDKDQETQSVRENLRQAQARLQEELKKKEELEKTIQELSVDSSPSSREGSISYAEAERPMFSFLPQRSNTLENKSANRKSVAFGPGSGLRELKLGRTNTISETPPTIAVPTESNHVRSGSVIPSRGSSLSTQKIFATQNNAPATEDDMLVELINAKTSEAAARQELEEVKAKLDSMRKMLGVPSPPVPAPATPDANHKSSASEAVATPSRQTSKDILSPQSSTPSSGVTAALTGGFWGWGKRSTSTSSQAPAQAQAQASGGTEEKAKV